MKKSKFKNNGQAVTVYMVSEETAGLNLLTVFFNAICRTGRMPYDGLKSTFETLPKKTDASKRDECMVSLMSHVLKVFYTSGSTIISIVYYTIL